MKKPNKKIVKAKVKHKKIAKPAKKSAGKKSFRQHVVKAVKKKIHQLKVEPHIVIEPQPADIDILIKKTIKAAKKYKVETIMLSGGVSANEELRVKMTEAINREFPKTRFLIPERQYTTDNAAMIATAAAFLVNKKKVIPYNKLKVDPSLQLR